MIHTLWTFLSHIGTTNNHDKDTNSRISLSNKISLIGCLFSFPFIVFFSFLGLPLLTLGIFIICSLFLCNILLNHFKKHTLAKLGTIFFPTITIFIYCLFTGKDTGFHFALFPTATVGLLMFQPKQKKCLCFSIIIPIILFIFVEMFGQHLTIITLFSDTSVPYLKFYSIILSFACVIISVKFHIIQTIHLSQFEQDKRHQITHELQETMTKLEEKTHLLESYSSKDAYIQMTQGLAHEIRSPMAILLSGSELLKNNVYHDQESAIKFADIMITTIKQLKNLCSSMLKINAPMTQHMTSFCIQDLLSEIITLSEFQCRKKRIKLQLICHSDEKLTGNREFISQVFLNLMINAIQHTPAKGIITIEILNPENKHDTHLTILVKDTGNGIAPDHLPHIFNAHTTSQTSSDNSGLGLAFVKRVIDEHHGHINVTSTPEKGTTFTIKLPKTSPLPLRGQPPLVQRCHNK